ncbi:hypothetical protein N656DRAFT_765123 [Canariomyces notabilis]|jgi:hypothetical protein|uniref:Allergen Asp f 4 n=1 Tax=Canariomyces notabilis TaxID=2074819 RepID=A0AAN6TKE2_9PEZI|nr:hypothetical protein N656DRAFT_765123 [Canariomyces arenarius]
MQLPHFLLLAGALGAAAHPSGHMHLHRNLHTKRDGPVFVKNVHSRPTVKATSTTVAPAPAASTPSVKSTETSATESTSDSNEYIAFCGGGASSKRATYAQIMYTGNTGTANGCAWNSNLMVVPNNIADKYQYVQEYTNVASEPYQVICANKMGADGQLTGMFKVDGQNPLIFTLKPGETKTVVADANTQGVCAFAPNEVPTTKYGQYAGVWAEFDFANTSNNGWSGADCSSLVAQAYDMDVPGCRMSQGGVDSTIYPGGKGDNAYTKGMEDLDGIGLNIPAGKTTVKVLVGFSG